MPHSSRRRSWFGTIFESGGPRVATCAVLIGFAALFFAGIALPTHGWWFNAPAVLAIVTWHLVMMARYEESFPGKASWFGTLTRPTSHFVGTTVVNATCAAGWALSRYRPDWQPELSVIALTPMLAWYTAMSIVHRRKECERDAAVARAESAA